jgi:predicted DNA-binding transcriptional regulator AlpA
VCLMPRQKKSHLSKVIEFPSSSASPTQDTLEPFITVKQLAERLQVKTSTVWEWSRRRNTNPIPHYPVSRKVVYFRWSEVVRWIESQREAA